MADGTTAPEALRKTYGLADLLRTGRGDILAAILEGEDLLAVMPTGAVKSLCYRIARAAAECGWRWTCSPLIALMRSQVAQLQAFGIAAGALNSSNSREETGALLQAPLKRPPLCVCFFA